MTLTAPAASAAELQLETLESKVHRALEMLAQARAENARLREELAARDRQSSTAEQERQEVRQRVERLVKQVDALIKED
jgi:DNA repair exonuclease SbcCD ATPase subunit